ncbi:YifB family Mg chelatase-like AAA ATPase [Actinomyces minihominis]|uniref:YifB family Mg chelatase-like AAA ATPase n=1 Tax=Actinomyces minihominis TaxID=2002838 RepID=UPI0013EE13E1|nr:YifB family Mg chelatase-like AAA ATPase [Actinomyces minihominis]
MTSLARTYTVALAGLLGTVVEVQTHIGPGIVGTTLVGLPDASLREAKERVRAALFSCAVPTLNKRVTINLSPADLPKAGSGFDLGIAISVLVARGELPNLAVTETVFAAELGLDGSLQPVPGALPIALAAREAGFSRLVVSPEMMGEARLVEGIEVVGGAHLADILTVFRQRGHSLVDSLEGWEIVQGLTDQRMQLEADTLPHQSRGGMLIQGEVPEMDVADVRGQPEAVQALGIAAAGGHHMLMLGPPGVGKTMLATRLQAVLPDLSKFESVQVTALRSLVGGSAPVDHLAVRPPLEQPHHSASLVSLIGGGSPVRPGSVSLAHAGVLVLDEAPEFQVRVLDALRQPLESGMIAVHRAQQRVEFPARFQMVMTANPCPCGGAIRSGDERCRCSYAQRDRYWARISGPLLDRLDIRLHISRPHHSALTRDQTPTSAELRERTTEARRRAAFRWRNEAWSVNAEVPGRFLRDHTQLAPADANAVQKAIESGQISLRGADRILRLAWSVADWEGHETPSTEDMARAIELRGQEERIR